MKTELPTIGKVSSEIFDEIILPQLGRKRPEILMGPRHGVDVGVVDLGHGQVMVTTTDPIFVVPPYGWERSGWFAIHILASDAVTSGIRPNYITMDLNLPLSMTREEFEALWAVMHRECDKIGMAVISGHTGRYEGCEYPMIGGATVIGIGPKDRYVTPDMARLGDIVILTKGAAIEAAGLFAVTFPERVAERYGEKAAREAEEIFWQMSIVEDAFTAMEAGVREDGVTTMHDATECGVWGGLFEVATGVGRRHDDRQGEDHRAGCGSERVRPVRHRPVFVDQRGDADPHLQAAQGEGSDPAAGRQGDPGEHGGGDRGAAAGDARL